MKCTVPGCDVAEPSVGTLTCVIWGGRRLCYATHFPEWVRWQDAHGDRPPNETEWKAWVAKQRLAKGAA